MSSVCWYNDLGHKHNRIYRTHWFRSCLKMIFWFLNDSSHVALTSPPWAASPPVGVAISLLLLSSFFIIIIIIIIFMMCHFNEYAGFTWFSCHAGFIRLLLDGCYGRWFVYVKQRNSVMLSTACRRHVHPAENEFRWQEYRSAINQIREISLMQWPEPAW